MEVNHLTNVGDQFVHGTDMFDFGTKRIREDTSLKTEEILKSDGTRLKLGLDVTGELGTFAVPEIGTHDFDPITDRRNVTMKRRSEISVFTDLVQRGVAI